MLLMKCNNVELLRTIMFIKEIVAIIFMLIPIILILLMAIDFAKMVISNDNDMERNKRFSFSLKRVILVLTLFLVPTMVEVLMSLLGEVNSNWDLCYSVATSENIEKVKVGNIEKLLLETKNELTITNLMTLKREISNIKDSQTQKKYELEYQKLQEAYNKTKLEEEEEKEEEKKEEEKPPNEEESKKDYTIYIGDSRTVGMCRHVQITSQESCIAKGSMGLKWFNSTALSELKKVLQTHPNSNIVINMGTNDLNNASKYAEAYNKLANEYPNSKVVAISVTVIDDSLAKRRGYRVCNASVLSFNSKLKSLLNSNVTYCDVYTETTGNIKTTDGVHYDRASSNKIYQAIQECL